MHTTNRMLQVFAAALLIGSLWPLTATAMQGHDGPPPCETEECFVKAVLACEEGAGYMPAAAAGAQVQYMIDSEMRDGGCKVGMIYMRHPVSGWTYKPLYVVLDRQGNIETQLKDSVTSCVEGHAIDVWQCSGALMNVTGTKAQ